jgi:TRAP-type transport system small permease protein
MLQVLSRGLRLLDAAIEWMVASLMAVILAIVTLQFVDRHFFDTGIAAPDQYARIALVWLTFIGFTAAVRAAVNVRVDLIDAHLPARIRSALAVAFDVLLLLLLVILIPGSWRLVEIGKDQLLLGTVFSAAVPAAGALCACVLMVLYVGLRVLVRLAGSELPGSREI